MKIGVWVCLAFCIWGCQPNPQPQVGWEGTYIGYFHQNQADTTPLTLTIEGRYYAAAPRTSSGHEKTAGVFEQKNAALVFYSPDTLSTALIQGSFQYKKGPDGTLRIWKNENNNLVELLLRQQ